MKKAILFVVIGFVVSNFVFAGGTAKNFSDIQAKRAQQIESQIDLATK